MDKPIFNWYNYQYILSLHLQSETLDISLKKVFIFFIIIFSTFTKIYCDEKISIGISAPYLKNESAVTMFYHKHFSFEVLFDYDDEQYLIEIIRLEMVPQEEVYLTECKNETIKNGIDYLLYSTVYSNNSYLFFKVQLLNPYNASVIFSKFYKKKIDYTINESLSDCSKEIVNLIKNSELEKIEKKLLIDKKNKKDKNDNQEFEVIKAKYKHEIFFLNSFFKNHPNVMSFLEFCSGYNFSPFDFFSIESGIFLGGGYLDIDFNLNNIILDKLFLGGYAAFYLFLSGIVEPSVGLKFEFCYVLNNDVCFSFPIAFGLKFYINPKNIIRFDTSFQFIYYDFNKLVWKNNFVIGFLIGYAKKI